MGVSPRFYAKYVTKPRRGDSNQPTRSFSKTHLNFNFDRLTLCPNRTAIETSRHAVALPGLSIVGPSLPWADAMATRCHPSVANSAAEIQRQFGPFPPIFRSLIPTRAKPAWIFRVYISEGRRIGSIERNASAENASPNFLTQRCVSSN